MTKFKTLALLAITSTSLLLSSCGKEAPKCSDKGVTDVVKKIYIEQIGEYASNGAAVSYTVKNIRTTNFNKDTGTYFCSASVIMKREDNQETAELPVKYKSELLDNGKEFYVTILR